MLPSSSSDCETFLGKVLSAYWIVSCDFWALRYLENSPSIRSPSSDSVKIPSSSPCRALSMFGKESTLIFTAAVLSVLNECCPDLLYISFEIYVSCRLCKSRLMYALWLFVETGLIDDIFPQFYSFRLKLLKPLLALAIFFSSGKGTTLSAIPYRLAYCFLFFKETCWEMVRLG